MRSVRALGLPLLSMLLWGKRNILVLNNCTRVHVLILVTSLVILGSSIILLVFPSFVSLSFVSLDPNAAFVLFYSCM